MTSTMLPMDHSDIDADDGRRDDPDGRRIGSNVTIRTAPVALVTDDAVDDRLLVQHATQGDEDAFRSA